MLSSLIAFFIEILQLISELNRYLNLQDLIANFLCDSAGIIIIQFLFTYSIKD